MSPAQKSSTIRRLAGAALSLSAVGCGSPDQAVEETAAPVTQAAARPASPGEDWLNAMDGDLLFAALNDASRWTRSTDSPAQRRCVDPASCGTTGMAGLNLWVEKNAHNVGDVMAGDTAILVGKLRHTGTVGESRMYRVRPGPYVYALFIMRGDATSGLYQIRELNTSTKQHVAHSSGTWVRCGHDLKEEAEAQFRSCEPPHKDSTAVASLTHEDPAWFSCTDGCCTAGLMIE